MPKIQYTWSKVVPGDIISFRYKGKKTVGTLTTLLVLNPRLPNTKKDGTKNFHLVGLKLEERGVIPTIRNKPRLVQIFEKIGSIEVVSGDDEIYRVQIANQDKLGIKPAVYDTLKRELKTFSVYRTYDYLEARKSQVFLEPIKLPKNIREALIEN
tara:strand:- start:70 stop:534 length:465 start_codon:yes stop_codon:yes gene_type:complete